MIRSRRTQHTIGLEICHCKILVLIIFSLQNGLVLKLLRIFFDNQRIHHRSHHEGLGGVKTHENSLFLYKSIQADSLIRSRMIDYLMLGCLLGWVGGLSPLLFLPVLAASLSLPRKIAVL